MGRRGDAAKWDSSGGPGARTLGVWTLVVLFLVLVSGVPMAFVYELGPANAHDAVARLDEGLWQLLRGAHAWAAHLAVAFVLVHVARAYIGARFGVIGRRRAMAGLAAYAVVVGAYFLGTILTWDQQGWEAYQHLQAAGGAVGVGAVSDDPSATPLGVVFWLHVLAVPLLLLGALTWHLRGASDGGAGVAAAARRVGGLVRTRGRSASLVAGLVVAAGVLWPPEFGPAPLAGLVVAKPDWPFLWLVPLQDWFGPVALWVLPLLFVVAGVLLWRGAPHGPMTRRVVLAVTGAVFLALGLGGAW